MASKAPQDNKPTGGHCKCPSLRCPQDLHESLTQPPKAEFFAGAQSTTMRDMNTNTYNGQAVYSFDASTYHDNAVRNQATHGAHMTVNMPSPQPVHTRSHSRSSSSTRSSTRTAPDRYPAPSYYEAPKGENTLGAVPQNPYGSRHPGNPWQEPTPQGSSIDEGRRPSGLLALARDNPAHSQSNNGISPPQLASPGLDMLSGFGMSSLLRGPSSLGGPDGLSPDDSRSVALRTREEAEIDTQSLSTPPALGPRVAQPDVEQQVQTQVQSPAPGASSTSEDVDSQPQVAATSAHENPQEEARPKPKDGEVDTEAEQTKFVLEVERSAPLDQRTSASGPLSLGSPSRAHFNPRPGVDDQSSISDESEPDAEALAGANAPPGRFSVHAACRPEYCCLPFFPQQHKRVRRRKLGS